jgi:hypothetical protein
MRIPQVHRAWAAGRWRLLAALALVAVVALSIVLPGGPVQALGTQRDDEPAGPVTDSTPLGTAERVLVFTVPTLTWEDLDTYHAPNLERLLAESAVADLSVRSVSRSTSAVDGYATLNAGTRTEGTLQASLAFVAGISRVSVDGDPTQVPPGAFEPEPPNEDVPDDLVPAPTEPEVEVPAEDQPPLAPEAGETFDGSPAAEEFARRTGVLPEVGEVFNLGVVSMRQLNSTLLFDAEVGALGDALAEHGVDRAVIANGDHGEGSDTVTYRREASVGLMDSNGLVDHGRVGRTLLETDPTAPFGTRYDNDEVAEAFGEFWDPDSVVLVEASDMVRDEDVVPLVLSSQRERLRGQAIAHSDELLAKLLEQVDPARDAVVVVAPYASGQGTNLTVVGVKAPSLEPGLLSSGTTRRAGFIQTVDLAPSILSLVGADTPSSMEGTVMERASSGGDFEQRRDFLVQSDLGAEFRDATLGAASVVFVLAQLALWGLALWTLTRPGRRLRTMSEVATLSVLTYLPVTYLAGLMDFHRYGSAAWWAFVLVTSFALAAVIQAVTRRYLVDPLIATLGFIVAFLTVDIAVGGPLQFNTVFGYTPTVAGRFNGIGNPAFSMLAAAGIILAALIAHRIGGRRGIWAAVALLAWCVVLDGAPNLGADVGGALALVPSAGVTAMLLLGWRIRLRTAVIGLTATVVVVLGFGFLDLSRPPAQRTHLGRLLADVGDNGFGAFQTVVLRKLNANLSVLTSSIWTLMLPLVFAFVAFLFWWAPWRLRTISERVPQERAAVGGLITAMVLGFALNDSGISVPGMMLGVVNASLINLLLRVDDDLPSSPADAAERRSDPGTAGEAPEPAGPATAGADDAPADADGEDQLVGAQSDRT